jgi:P27 family predicted phage terminase small subunit
MKGGGIKNNTKAAASLKKKGAADGRMEIVLKIEARVPDSPSHFDERHAAKWTDIATKVVEAGIFKTLDLDTLQAYCENWVIMEDAMKTVQDQGAVLWIETPAGKKPMRNPAHLVYMEAFKVCKAFMEQYGMTPRSRQAIIVQEKPTQYDPAADL